MRQIRDEVVALSSTLADERRQNGVLPVLGEGNHDAEIMFVGEAPGRNEAATGRPFCGAAGRILDELIESIGLKREEVYITNVVKDRPPQNRDPFPDEIALYGPLLERQIDIIRPKVLATLGRFSMDYLLRRFGLEAELASISRLHGKTFRVSAPWGNLAIVPLYHPAVAIYNIHQKTILLDDIKVLLGCLL
ncbi:uracil-DNA glycosylase [Candidatus Uhrbacteria bacterium]|nr:uracil-DNA glycosylase [Candidatus Uhrbacteria bacterium]